MDDFAIVSLTLVIVAVVGYAIFAVIMALRVKNVSIDDFITARRSQGKWTIALAMFSSQMGASTTLGPAQYASFAGIIGVVFYALAMAIPILMIGYLGDVVLNKYTKVDSLNDFVHKRFGGVAKVFTTLIVLLNISIALIAEYTSIGAIFSSVVGVSPIIPILIVGIVTMGYTAIGGLKISLITDRYQAILALTLLSVVVVYAMAAFRPDLSQPLPENLGPNQSGYSSIFALPISILSATLYSEAVWQRVWASETRHVLRFGSSVGALLIFIVMFIYGFLGWLALWGSGITPETDPNTYFFYVFGENQRSWIAVITIVIAAIMNESAIDSMQNAIAACISTNIKDKSINYARLVVVIINIPLIVVGLQNYQILQLFLISNLITTCCLMPLLLGLYLHHFNQYHFLLACLSGFIGVSVLGIAMTGTFAEGMELAWVTNNYDYSYFLIATFLPMIVILLLNVLSKKMNWGNQLQKQQSNAESYDSKAELLE